VWKSNARASRWLFDHMPKGENECDLTLLQKRWIAEHGSILAHCISDSENDDTLLSQLPGIFFYFIAIKKLLQNEQSSVIEFLIGRKHFRPFLEKYKKAGWQVALASLFTESGELIEAIREHIMARKQEVAKAEAHLETYQTAVNLLVFIARLLATVDAKLHNNAAFQKIFMQSLTYGDYYREMENKLTALGKICWAPSE
jgi:hypothetical protein